MFINTYCVRCSWKRLCGWLTDWQHRGRKKRRKTKTIEIKTVEKNEVEGTKERKREESSSFTGICSDRQRGSSIKRMMMQACVKSLHELCLLYLWGVQHIGIILLSPFFFRSYRQISWIDPVAVNPLQSHSTGRHLEQERALQHSYTHTHRGWYTLSKKKSPCSRSASHTVGTAQVTEAIAMLLVLHFSLPFNMSSHKTFPGRICFNFIW